MGGGGLFAECLATRLPKWLVLSDENAGRVSLCKVCDDDAITGKQLTVNDYACVE